MPTETEETTQTTETAETATTEQVAQPSFQEVEKAYRDRLDSQRGKTPEAKTEVKETAKETEKPKVEDVTTEETTTTETPTPEKKKSGIARLNNKLNRATQENQELKERLAALEGKLTVVTAPKPAEAPVVEQLVEPTRDKFDTDAAYLLALRAYDKQVSAKQIEDDKQAAAQKDTEAAWNNKVTKYNESIKAAKAKFPDFDKVKETSNVSIGRRGDVEHNTVLMGVLMDAGPETVYSLLKSPSDARHISDIDKDGLFAVGNADDVAGVVKWLSTHPDDIDVLNGLTPIKAQKFIGKIEFKIEAESASLKEQAEKAKTVEKTQRTVEAQPEAKKPEVVKTQAQAPAVATRQPGPTRPKADIPPKMEGNPPSGSDWRDPADMSFTERERMYREAKLLTRR